MNFNLKHIILLLTSLLQLPSANNLVLLVYGGAGTLVEQGSTGTGLAVGGRRGMSDIAWHPDNVWFIFMIVGNTSLTCYAGNEGGYFL
jgi:hypothetical protein